jgi:hypothetical protein
LALGLLLPESPAFLSRRGRAEELARFLRRCGLKVERAALLTTPPSIAPGAAKPKVRAPFQPRFLFLFVLLVLFIRISWWRRVAHAHKGTAVDRLRGKFLGDVSDHVVAPRCGL